MAINFGSEKSAWQNLVTYLYFVTSFQSIKICNRTRKWDYITDYALN